MSSLCRGSARLWGAQLLVCVFSLLFSLSGVAASLQILQSNAPVPVPVKTEVIVDSAGQHWSNLSIKVTNSLSEVIDARNLQVDFSAPVAVSSIWGTFSSISYPSQFKTSSVRLESGLYRTSVVLGFSEDSWIKTELKPGASFTLQFGLSLLATQDTVKDIQVFPEQPVIADGVISLKAPSAPGADVSHLKPRVTITGAGQFEQSEELAWGEVKAVSNLGYGDYVIHIQQVGAYPPSKPTFPITLSKDSKEVEVAWVYG